MRSAGSVFPYLSNLLTHFAAMTEHGAMNDASYVALAGLEAAPLENGAVLYHPQSKKFVMLNRSAALIWNELATPKTIDQLVARLCATFPDVDANIAAGDVHAALDRFKDLELLAAGN